MRSHPLKKNRLVDDTGGVEKYKAVEQLIWNEFEIKQGKVIKVKGLPDDKKVKLFRVIVSTNKTRGGASGGFADIATNDLAQGSTDAVQQVCVVRWKIEE